MDLLIQESEWERRNNMLEDKDFALLEETPVNEIPQEEVAVSKDDFQFVQIDESAHEQKMQTKPTTFLKDSLKRFRKNKSSVVAAYILGTLLLMSFLVPLFDRNDTVHVHKGEEYLAPKLFNAGTGFWDGTKKLSNIAVDISEMPNATTEEEKQAHWWPSSKYPQRSAIKNKKFTDLQYCNDISALGTFGKDGYVHFGYYYDQRKDEPVEFTSKQISSLTIDNDLYLSVFDTYDAEKIHARERKDDLTIPENFELGESAFYFRFTNENGHVQEIQLVDYAVVHNIGSAVVSSAEDKLDIAKIIYDQTGETTFNHASFFVRMNPDKNANVCSLIAGIAFECNSTNEEIKKAFDDMSFTDATSCVIKNSEDKGYVYWSSNGVRRVYLSKAYFCSFTYDTYEAAYGVREDPAFSVFKLLDYEDYGWMSFKDNLGFPSLYIEEEEGEESKFCIDTVNFKCTILNPEKCPIAEELTIDNFVYPTPGSDGIAKGTIAVKVKVTQYKYLGYSSMPRFIMGTNKDGKDMFKYVFEGLRTSLLLGFLTFIVCFLFGLLWGSICGYFGGTTDLLMERFTDILAGVPWIVMMTLIIKHLGQNFWTFAIALCMTGWIGTAARTRTQFYRFRGREYVLASRTLGASDARLITKHILPNALGTIITGAVLMIPSVIFSEATISYLGLGLKGMSSLGVILSDNQAELITDPYLLIFPAVVIALIMISFNLFGNGLRDAINPSLKGEEN